MTMPSVVQWMLLLASIAVGYDAARILAVLPAPSRSHLISFEALTKELAARGHQVTVVSMFPQEKPLANYTDVAVPFNFFGMEDKIMKMKDISMFDMTSNLLNFGKEMCDHFLGHPDVQKLVNADDDSFDLLIIEVFFNECFMGFTHKFKVPMIGITPMGGTHWMLDIMGNPSPYAYVPDPFLGTSDHMTFLQRMKNSVFVTAGYFLRSLLLLPAQDAMMRKYFNASGPIPYAGDIQRETSVLLLNNHVSINYPRPYLPNVVEIGGMHIKPGKKLPRDLQKYLDEAKDGVVYFSMGSNLKSSQLPEAKRHSFLDAFSKLDQRVLWKWEEESLPGQPENVRLGKWLPQSSILEHPNVKLFITHGGLLSMQEAVYHGKPTIGIPIFGDQELNVKRAELLGFGLRVDFETLTSESLQLALDRVLNNPSYRESAARLSARFRDQPTTPLERAVYWTEYVISHKGAPHLRSAALDLAWYQNLLLDVIALLLLGASLVGLLLYIVTKAVVRRVCGKMCNKSVHKPKGKVNQVSKKPKRKLN